MKALDYKPTQEGKGIFLFISFFFSSFKEHKTVLWVLPHTLCIHIIHQTATRRDQTKEKLFFFFLENILHT